MPSHGGSPRRKKAIVIVSIFSILLLINIIQKHNEAQEKERMIKEQAEIVRLGEIQRQAEERRAAEEEAKRIAQEKRYKAVITECYVDAPCRSFDRVAILRKEDITVGDFTCPLKGKPGVDGYGACSVSFVNGNPVSMKQWDPNDGFVTSRVTIGERVKVGQYDPEMERNPHEKLSQERWNQVMQDWEKEKQNAEVNCRGLRGDAYIYCAGAQTAGSR